jgi:hypothetical protein
VKLSGEVDTDANANCYKTIVLIYCFNESYETNVLMSRKINLGGTGFQPVLAQAKACGYIF